MSDPRVRDDERGTSGFLRIGELARRTGVTVELLRAWEKRYGLLSPKRTSGGFRLYDAGDEHRVRRMRDLISSGLSAGEAAKVALAGAGPASDLPRSEASPELGRLGSSLESALDRYDDVGANEALDRMLSGFTIATVFGEVLLPYLHRLGERWSQGSVSVAQEHFASGLIRGRLLGLARGWGLGGGPHAVLACPPGELHDLPLIMLGVLLSRFGWRITYLGTDTPLDTLSRAAKDVRPDVIVLSATDPERFAAAAGGVSEVAAAAPTALAGAGADDDVIARLAMSRLEGDPVSAADTLAGGWRPTKAARERRS